MNAFKKLFAEMDPASSAGAIIGWWESRRVYYNLIIFGWALILLLIGLVTASILGKRNSFLELRNAYFWEFLALYYPLFFQFPANIWYTGGWIVNLIVTKILHLPSHRFAPWALGFGIGFSLLFYLLVFLLFVVALRSSIKP